jgi:hypothetical protein
MVVIDEDDDNDDFCLLNSDNPLAPRNITTHTDPRPQNNNVMNLAPESSERSSDTSTPGPLSSLQKWKICTLWSTNRPWSEIAALLNISEAVFHAYVYDLIKRDAINSSDG